MLGCFVAFYYLIHIAYDLPYLVNGLSRFTWLPADPFALVSRVKDILLSFLFALCPFLLLSRFYPKHRLFCVLGIVIGLAGIYGLRFGVESLWQDQNIRMRFFFLSTIFYVILYTVYGIVFYFIRYTHYKELQQKELLLQHHQSELSFLRSQVNPHFLFNSLNNIYALVYQGSPQALTAIAGLSDLLRYMLYDTTERVPMEKELDYIKKYIDLQKLRFEQTIKAEIRTTGNNASVDIPPLLLIPFVENAFKHGDFTNAGDGLSVTVHTTDKKTWFHCHNKKGSQLKDAAGGIGLDNVKRRLQLLYPGRHVMTIENGTEHFTVNLELIHA